MCGQDDNVQLLFLHAGGERGREKEKETSRIRMNITLIMIFID